MQLTEFDRPSIEDRRELERLIAYFEERINDRREKVVSTTAPRTEWGGFVVPDETKDDIKELRKLRRMRV